MDPDTLLMPLRLKKNLIIVASALQPVVLGLVPSNVVSSDEFEKFKDEISRDVKNGSG